MAPPLKEAIVLGSLIFSIMSVVHPLIKILATIDRNNDRLQMTFYDYRESFDIIIVGGGSTGCALANRLSEDFSVLLLEAGGTPNFIQYLPILSYFIFSNPSVDWVHKTVPQKHGAFGLLNNSVLWSSGKSLGGSSALNAMIYIRGNTQGFDDIAQKVGDYRWSTQNVLEYYRQMENYNGWFVSQDHKKGGSLQIEKPTLSRYVDNLMSAGDELGYQVRDPNPQGPYTEGFAKMDLYMRKGRRSDAFSEFIVPIWNRENLVVRKYSTATKILFAPGTTRAVGVEYERHGQLFQAYASKEVILSAGALGSPKLLMLSGIGPKNHLEEVGISPLVDLPVGQYLQDKYGALIGPFIVDEGHSLVYDRDLTVLDALSWLKVGNGRLKTSLTEATYAIKTGVTGGSNKSSAEIPNASTAPDIHSYVISISMGGEEMPPNIGEGFNLKPSIANFFRMSNKSDSFIQLVTINRQKGHGYVKLRSADPQDELEIDPKYLEDPEDFQHLLEGLKFSVKLVEDTKSFKKINGRLLPIPVPGCESVPFKSDEYFECLARQVTISAFKYSGTCPVGKAGDADAVVDSKFKVFGTEGLRVADGSNLQQKYVSVNDVTCRMLGLLAGDIIKEDLYNVY